MLDINTLEELIYNAPLGLLSLKDENSIALANSYLPYSTGFEIECSKSDIYNESTFKYIPSILDVNVDNSEQRYRIPNGIVGLICLYNICYNLNTNSLLNMESGIHYHIDCNEVYDKFSGTFFKSHEDWILKELDLWNFRGRQKRGISISLDPGNYFTGTWLRNNSLRTLEYRVGNMSFDYKVLVKNIISANSITKRLKEDLNKAGEFIEYDKINLKSLLEYQKLLLNNNNDSFNYNNRIASLNKKLEEIQTKQVTITNLNLAKEAIKNRSHRL